MDGQTNYFVYVSRCGVGVIVYGWREVIVRIYVHCGYTGQQVFTVLRSILSPSKKYVPLKRTVSFSGRLAHCPRLPLPVHTRHRSSTARSLN